MYVQANMTSAEGSADILDQLALLQPNSTVIVHGTKKHSLDYYHCKIWLYYYLLLLYIIAPWFLANQDSMHQSPKAPQRNSEQSKSTSNTQSSQYLIMNTLKLNQYAQKAKIFSSRVVTRLAKSKRRNFFLGMTKNCLQQISQPGSVFC